MRNVSNLRLCFPAEILMGVQFSTLLTLRASNASCWQCGCSMFLSSAKSTRTLLPNLIIIYHHVVGMGFQIHSNANTQQCPPVQNSLCLYVIAINIITHSNVLYWPATLLGIPCQALAHHIIHVLQQQLMWEPASKETCVQMKRYPVVAPREAPITSGLGLSRRSWHGNLTEQAHCPGLKLYYFCAVMRTVDTSAWTTLPLLWIKIWVFAGRTLCIWHLQGG